MTPSGASQQEFRRFELLAKQRPHLNLACTPTILMIFVRSLIGAVEYRSRLTLTTQVAAGVKMPAVVIGEVGTLDAMPEWIVADCELANKYRSTR